MYANLYTSFKDLYNDQRVKRPIVIFPQCAKTNGRGVLDFPANVPDMLEKAKSDFKIHSLRFDYEFTYFSPYNTTDVLGLKHTIGMLAQFINPVTVQYYFDLQNY